MIISRSQKFCTKFLAEIYLTFTIFIRFSWNFQGRKLEALATRVTFFHFSRFLPSFWDISVFVDKGTPSKNFQCPKMTLKKSKSKIQEFVPNLRVKNYMHVKFHDPRLIGVACSSVTTFFGFFPIKHTVMSTCRHSTSYVTFIGRISFLYNSPNLFLS